jgi:hypothetical protein
MQRTEEELPQTSNDLLNEGLDCRADIAGFGAGVYYAEQAYFLGRVEKSFLKTNNEGIRACISTQNIMSILLKDIPYKVP